MINELFVEIPAQPDFSEYVMCGSDDIISRFYEPLRRSYSDYISRNMIGTDTSGQYQMWLYDFCPDHYEACVYLQSGVHPIETEGYLGLARIAAAPAARHCFRRPVNIPMSEKMNAAPPGLRHRTPAGLSPGLS